MILTRIFTRPFFSLVLMAAVCGAAMVSPTHGQSITVNGTTGLIDEELSILVEGVQPSAVVVVRASMEDARRTEWSSEASFVADENGEVDLRKQAPQEGSYGGVNPMGLIEFMQSADGSDIARFEVDAQLSYTTRFSLEVDGAVVARTETTSTFSPPGLDVTTVHENGLNAKFYHVPDSEPRPGLILLGGSDGGLASDARARLLAARGYSVLSLAYFREERLPENLEEVPLEYFQSGIDWMESQEPVADDWLGFVGSSKGAEAALLVASIDSRIKAVVAYCPSSVVWSGLGRDRSKSSWSFRGEPVRFVPYATPPVGSQQPGEPLRPGVNYLHRLQNSIAVEAAAIPVEQINGPLLLISGTDDDIWPSYEMSRQIILRLKDHDFGNFYTHFSCRGAGHQIRTGYLPIAGSTFAAAGRISTGGSAKANARMQSAAWARTLSFLKTAYDSRD